MLFFLIQAFPFGQFSQLSLEHRAPQRADPIYKQDPVQMIRLMEDHTGSKFFAFEFMRISIDVQKTDPDLGHPGDLPVNAGDAQTPLLVDFFPLFADDLGIDHRDHMLPILT